MCVFVWHWSYHSLLAGSSWQWVFVESMCASVCAYSLQCALRLSSFSFRSQVSLFRLRHGELLGLTCACMCVCYKKKNFLIIFTAECICQLLDSFSLLYCSCAACYCCCFASPCEYPLQSGIPNSTLYERLKSVSVQRSALAQYGTSCGLCSRHCFLFF